MGYMFCAWRKSGRMDRKNAFLWTRQRRNDFKRVDVKRTWPNLPWPLFCQLTVRHIFLTGHGGHEVLFCPRGRLWANVFGANHRVHSSDDRARAGDVAGGVVAPRVWETELAQPQR